MRNVLLALSVLTLGACGAEKSSPEPLDAKDACSNGMIVNDYGNCVSAVPYTCGWKRNNPGALESTGSSIGDVVANLSLVDQCSEKVELWDFYGEYNILWMTGAS